MLPLCDARKKKWRRLTVDDWKYSYSAAPYSISTTSGTILTVRITDKFEMHATFVDSNNLSLEEVMMFIREEISPMVAEIEEAKRRHNSNEGAEPDSESSL